MGFFDAFDTEEDEDQPFRADDPTAQLPVKGAYCPLCQGSILLSAMPQAETMKGSRRQFTALAKQGYDIRIQPKILAIAPERCECGGPVKQK